MSLNDHGKLLLLSLIALGALGLCALGRVDFAGVLPLLTGIVGYVTGNGVLAVRRSSPSPMLAPPPPPYIANPDYFDPNQPDPPRADRSGE